MQACDFGQSNRVNLRSFASNAGSSGSYRVWVLVPDLLQPFCFHEGSQPTEEADPRKTAQSKDWQRNGTLVLNTW